jgi:hypothetical protein
MIGISELQTSFVLGTMLVASGGMLLAGFAGCAASSQGSREMRRMKRR